MRCKKHFSDLSSTVGVCSSCLRDRLMYLIDQQSKPPIQFQSYLTNPNPNFNRRNQQTQPPPLIFPRSVSPYITRRKSEPLQWFYSTPQVNINPPKKKQNSAGKFGLISKLFRSRSISSSSSSNSKLTFQNSMLTSHKSTVITCRNKGMSPENEFEIKYDERETSDSSPASWATRPSPARVRPSPARAASMATFCLSPLVRPSPSRQWRGSEKLGFPGEIRVPATGKCKSTNGSSETNSNSRSSNNKLNLSNAASFCANRSRKLADFGRLNPNR